MSLSTELLRLGATEVQEVKCSVLHLSLSPGELKSRVCDICVRVERSCVCVCLRACEWYARMNFTRIYEITSD